MTKTKVVDIENLCNFIVDKFFIWNHLCKKNYIWNSKFSNIRWRNDQTKVVDLKKVIQLCSWQRFHLEYLIWTYKWLVGVGVRKDEHVREKSWDLEPVWLPGRVSEDYCFAIFLSELWIWQWFVETIRNKRHLYKSDF